MKKTENPFRILYDRVSDYITASVARRVFFTLFVIVILIAFSMQFYHSYIAQSVLYAACALCAFATLVDTMQVKQIFLKQMMDMELEYVNRYLDVNGEDSLDTMTEGAFSMAEIIYMKKRKREYNVTISMKLLFVIVFIVLLGTSV